MLEKDTSLNKPVTQAGHSPTKESKVKLLPILVGLSVLLGVAGYYIGDPVVIVLNLVNLGLCYFAWRIGVTDV